MNIDIRRATLGDVALLSKLSIQTFLETFRGTCQDNEIEEFVEKYFNVMQVDKELRDENDFYYIASLDKIPAGYIRMKEQEIDVPVITKYKGIELKRIYVVKEYYGRKVGAALMKFVLEFATQKKYEAVWLGVWEHNERAKAFYKNWGFADTGVTHDFPIGNTPQTDHWYLKLIG